MIATMIDELRERALLVKRLRSIADIAEEIGASSQTIRQFFRGGHVGLQTIQAIEAWVITHERNSHD